jgi:hypothetical protein
VPIHTPVPDGVLDELSFGRGAGKLTDAGKEQAEALFLVDVSAQPFQQGTQPGIFYGQILEPRELAKILYITRQALHELPGHDQFQEFLLESHRCSP